VLGFTAKFGAFCEKQKEVFIKKLIELYKKISHTKNMAIPLLAREDLIVLQKEAGSLDPMNVLTNT
jgi:hypothetical protein